MELYISKEEIRKTHRFVGGRLGPEEPDTVMLQPGRIDRNDMHFLLGINDWQLFMHTIPNGDWYRGISPRLLYEVLLGIDKKKIEPVEAREQGQPLKGLIDLGRMIEDREVAKRIRQKMNTLEKISLKSGGRTIDNQGTRLLAEINALLLELCRDEKGLRDTQLLWNELDPGGKFPKPVLFANRADQWYLDNVFRLSDLTKSNSNTLSGQSPSLPDNPAWEDLVKEMRALGSLRVFTPADFGEKGLYHIPEQLEIGPQATPDHLEINWS